MIQRVTRRCGAALALIAAATLAGAAVAQDIPEGQSCGGLVCDLGLFGHKTSPRPAEARQVDGTAAVPQPALPPAHAAAASPPAAPLRKTAHRKVRAARTAAAVAKVPARPVAAGPTLGPPPVAATLVPAAGGTPAQAPRAAIPPAAAPEPAAVAAAPAANPRPMSPAVAAALADAVPLAVAPPPPPPQEPVVLATPYVSAKPMPFTFQSVDPTVH